MMKKEVLGTAANPHVIDKFENKFAEIKLSSFYSKIEEKGVYWVQILPKGKYNNKFGFFGGHHIQKYIRENAANKFYNEWLRTIKNMKD